MHGAHGGAPTRKCNCGCKHGAFTLALQNTRAETGVSIDECNELLASLNCDQAVAQVQLCFKFMLP